MKGLIVSLLATAGALCAAQTASAQGVVAWHQPAPVFFPGPVHTVASPIVVAPTPVTHFYRAPIIGHQRVPYVVTRRRPVLGGTVSRVRYRYRPVVF